jgi:hypothetical protein
MRIITSERRKRRKDFPAPCGVRFTDLVART